MTKREFLDKARDVHGYKYHYIDLCDDVNITTNDVIKLSYKGVVYTQRVVKHLMGRCPERNTAKKTTEQFINESIEVWGDKYDYSKVVYTGALNKVEIIHDGIVYEQVAISHLRGLAPEFHINYENFIKRSNIIHGNRYDYSMVDFISSDTPVLIGYEGVYYLQKPVNHLSGARPENLPLSIRKTTKKFIQESMLVHDYKYNYDKTEYIKNSEKVIITCLIHGDFEQVPMSHLSGHGCPSCNESKGEKRINAFLEKYSIRCKRQHRFEDCRNINPLPFDFYLPNIRTCIEFDGKQHFEPNEHFGGVEYFEKIKQNDSIKNEYCEDNFINLIRIKYTQYDNIEKILWETLKELIPRLNIR